MKKVLKAIFFIVFGVNSLKSGYALYCLSHNTTVTWA